MQFCQVFAHKCCFRPRSRMGVVVTTDEPNLGLVIWGPAGGSLGAHKPPQWDHVPQPLYGPISPRFWLIFARYPFLNQLSRFQPLCFTSCYPFSSRHERFHPSGPFLASRESFLCRCQPYNSPTIGQMHAATERGVQPAMVAC
jgi:hypothetical protein